MNVVFFFHFSPIGNESICFELKVLLTCFGLKGLLTPEKKIHILVAILDGFGTH